MQSNLKSKVHEFWNNESCGESLYLKNNELESYIDHSKERYKLEPFILSFVNFESTKEKKVLEIGVGLGADHSQFAQAGADLYGVDLTERAIQHTKRRFELLGLSSQLSVGDAENLIFSNNTFDIVYSWGVLHHSPNTVKAINEVYRVLKPGGTAYIMIYHKWSLVGLMLWIRYALLIGKPFRSLETIYDLYLESPGTKAYSTNEAKKIFKDFEFTKISIKLGHGDLLESNVGQRHRGIFLSLARKIWPRWLIKKLLPNAGLFMLIEAKK